MMSVLGQAESLKELTALLRLLRSIFNNRGGEGCGEGRERKKKNGKREQGEGMADNRRGGRNGKKRELIVPL